MALHVALYQPEIPPNTGNIIRLCANSGAQLHVIELSSFNLSDKQCRRAGLDYHEFAHVKQYNSYEDFCEQHQNRRIFACTTKGSSCYSSPCYQDEDMLLFGPETRGLPMDIIDNTPGEQRIRIPMKPESRSLNLSNATSIILYEAWRQLNFQ